MGHIAPTPALRCARACGRRDRGVQPGPPAASPAQRRGPHSRRCRTAFCAHGDAAPQATCSARQAGPEGGRSRGGSEASSAAALSRSASALACATVLASSMLLSPLDAAALDAASVGTCLLEKCQRQLARCIADEKCAESLVCLNKCNGTPDEAGCQIRCGDLYTDQTVRDFNTCAVTANKCVPQRVTDGVYPLPKAADLVQALDVGELEGRWYISAGLNQLFDTFPCQVHYFTSPEPGKMFVKINWRVGRPNGQFYERSDLQRFVQDPALPAALYNHDNETLHYQDDWYVAAYEKDAYFLVYYRGRNDAWDGYGGAVVYTRAPSLDASYVPSLTAAAERLGLRWADFTLTDNSCPAAPRLRVVAPPDLDTLADDIVAVEAGAEQGLEDSLKSFSRGFTLLRGREKAAETSVRKFVSQEFEEAEAALARIEMQARMQDVFSLPMKLLNQLLGKA